jgi:hypothetical protein
MVQIPPQIEKVCQNIDGFMVKYPSLTQYGKFLTWATNDGSASELRTWGSHTESV